LHQAAKILGWKLHQEVEQRARRLEEALAGISQAGLASVKWPAGWAILIADGPPGQAHRRPKAVDIVNLLRENPAWAGYSPSYWVIRGQAVIIVAAEALDAAFGQEVHRQLCDALDCPIGVGMSGIYEDPREWHVAYRDARFRWEHGWVQNPRGGAFHEARQAFWSIGQHLEPEFRNQFVERTLGPLLASRSRHVLWETLSTYFAAGGRLDAAAEQLFVHRNTLIYRLKRIEEILQRDLKNPDDLVDIRVAMSFFHHPAEYLRGLPVKGEDDDVGI
jgi:purine catabolism regulator